MQVRVIQKYFLFFSLFTDKCSILTDSIQQASFHTAYIAASVYVVEIIGPSKRHYGQLMSVGFGIGYMLSSPLAFWNV